MTTWPILKRGLVAILRGVKPDEVLGIGEALVAAGFEAIEVPLNSPEPFVSIELLANRYHSKCLIGAGTVLTPTDVMRLADAGGQLLVSPNVDEAVLAEAERQGLITMPGIFTPSEAFRALQAGASALKFFPASALGAGGIGGVKAVLPKSTVLGAVGGVTDADFAVYAKVGVTVFGLGSSLYKPGATAAEVGERARAAVAAWDRVFPPA